MAFLRASGVSRHATLGSVAFLVLSTWLCYVGDRVFDSTASHAELRARHRFYGMLWGTRRAALLSALGAVAVSCAAIAWVGLSASLFREYALLTALALCYFAWVHWGAARNTRVFAKEGAVGLIFALGCALPAWAGTSPASRMRLVPTAALFAIACWLNCVAIERWEGHGSVSARAHWSTHWAARHLAPLLCSAALIAATLVLLGADHHGNVPVASCLAVSFVLLAVLEWVHTLLSPEALRILADVALLTPLAWCLVPRLLR